MALYDRSDTLISMPRADYWEKTSRYGWKAPAVMNVAT